MKRYGYLYEKIYDMDNLWLGYYNARKNKTWYDEVKEVDKNPEFYLFQIKEMLINKTYKTSEYEVFKIWDKTKEREIYKLPFFPDRIVHHAIANIIEPILVKSLIEDTYSSIKKRGIHRGLNRIKQALKDEENTKYCLKLDIKHYYPSLNHDILKQLLKKKFKDNNLLWLLSEIIDSVNDNKGVPIGNYLSQIFGYYYLSYFEHWLKNNMKVKYLFVYCDDIVILSSNKESLHELLEHIKLYLDINLKLEVKNNYQVFPVDIRGIDFLGYRIFRNYILLRKRTADNFKKKMMKLKRKTNNGYKLQYKDMCSINSYKGWMKWCNSYNLQNKYITPLNKNILEFNVKKNNIKIKRQMDKLHKEFQEIINFLNEEDKLRECGELFENNRIGDSTTN